MKRVEEISNVVEPFESVDDVRTLAQAIVDTVREPLLVLDSDLTVVAASRSYCSTFQVSRQDVQGRRLDMLGDGQWAIPALRAFLDRIISEHTPMDAFEVEHKFPGIGERVMLLNARQVFYESSSQQTLLLAFEDISARRVIEREKEDLLRQTEELLRQKEMLLQEMEHRVANSLQIIASILMLKARSVTSEETRLHLQDAHQRVMSVAAVQRHLHASGSVDLIEIAPYLSTLCESLAASMIGEYRPILLQVLCSGGTAFSYKAVSLGLIVTELVINALKHGFPAERPGGKVVVSYEVNGSDWKLAVSDSGIGKPSDAAAARKGGLGTSIVAALAQQLDARVNIASGSSGTNVSITHSSFGHA